MVRFSEDTARPGLLLWPGVVEDHEGSPGAPQWLVWGDEPRAWIALLVLTKECKKLLEVLW